MIAIKHRIRQHAQAEIFKSGFRFTMADIARGCGVSTKTLYEWYPSKEELIRDLVEQAIQEIKEREKAILADQTLPVMDRLRALLVLLPQDFQYYDRIRLYELNRYYPDVWEALNHFMNEQWEGVKQTLAEAQAQGLLRPFSVPLFIQVYLGGLNRLMEDTPERQMGLTLKEMLDELVDMIVNGIRVR